MALTTSQLRFWGAGVREQIAAVHFHHGNDDGFRAGRRFIYELAAFLSEMNGRENVAALLFAIGDDVIGGKVPGDQDAPQAESALPGAPERAQAASFPIIAARERAAETAEWLKKNAPKLSAGAVLDEEQRAYYKLGYRDALRDIVKVAEAA